MLAAVADTHTVIWYLFASSRLSSEAKDAIEKAAADGRYVGVSAISLAEIVYLIEKGRIAPDTMERLMKSLADANQVFVEVPVDGRIVDAMSRVPRSDVPELPDRIVAATASRFDVPVITRDSAIQAANLDTIW